MSENPLANIPVITQAILDAQPLHFHSRKMDELDVLKLLAEKMNATIEIKNDIGEAQVRIYRDAGLRFPDEFPRGGNGSNQYQQRANDIKKCLADYGFIGNIPDRCRKIAALPEDMFEDLIIGIRQKEHLTHEEVTISFFYKAGKIHIMRMNGINTDHKQVEVMQDDSEFMIFDAGYKLGIISSHFDNSRDAFEHWKGMNNE